MSPSFTYSQDTWSLGSAKPQKPQGLGRSNAPNQQGLELFEGLVTSRVRSSRQLLTDLTEGPPKCVLGWQPQACITQHLFLLRFVLGAKGILCKIPFSYVVFPGSPIPLIIWHIHGPTQAHELRQSPIFWVLELTQGRAGSRVSVTNSRKDMVSHSDHEGTQE